jgi:ribonuclease-3
MILNYSFSKPELLQNALTHKSYQHELVNKEVQGLDIQHNERLEFLGDAILDLVIGELLMEIFPTAMEGDLSKMRAHLVNETSLFNYASKLGLHDKILLGKGEILTGGAQRPRLLASVFEAIIGAIYLDSNFSQVREVIRIIFIDEISALDLTHQRLLDFKSQLQEYSQSRLKKTPIYELLSQSGPPHEPVFEMQVFIGTEVLASGKGRTKKLAEQDAARICLFKFKELQSGGTE